MKRPADLAIVSLYGRAGAGSRVRLRGWIEHFGLDVEIFDYLSSANLSLHTLMTHWTDLPAAETRVRRLRRRRQIGRLLLSRQASPFSRGRLEAALLRRSAWGVYDFDDALWSDDRGGSHRVFSKPHVWHRSVLAADAVIAGSPYLADAASAHNDNVVVIPSCVEPDAYRRSKDYEITSSPMIVWVGSPTTERYLAPITPALLRLHKRCGARLRLVSAGDQPLGPLAAMTDRVEWSESAASRALADADVGVAPPTDDPWARGKCAYKLIQYGAASLPVVGSPVGANADVLRRLDGLSPATPDEWDDALVALLEEPPARRRTRGDTARRAIERHFSYEAWASPWLRSLGLPTRWATRGARGHQVGGGTPTVVPS